jgi:hypothetical protein
MATVYDVAEFILRGQGEMTAMKLQKLVYYSQAWHIAWLTIFCFQTALRLGKTVPFVLIYGESMQMLFALLQFRAAIRTL